MAEFTQRIREHFREVLKTKKSPHSVALGFAIGSFIAIMPTPFINVLIGILIILIFKKVSKISLFFAFIVWNPLMKAPLYILNFKIGEMIFGNTPVIKYNIEFVNIAINFTRRYLVGALITASIISVISYFIVLLIMRKYMERT